MGAPVGYRPSVPPSSRRQKELARLKAERQAERRAAAQRRRRIRTAATSGGVILVVFAVIAVYVLAGQSSTTTTATTSPTTSAAPSATSSADTRTVACGGMNYATPSNVAQANEPPLDTDKKTYTMTLNTSCGAIVASLDGVKANRTVNSLRFLAGEKFFDGTPCHRLTSGTLAVLQCGDPTGTGTGGPGYEIPQENLTGATYPRGTLAMANSGGTATTGSQFFLVYQDSQLPAQYTPVGTITSGLDILDKLAAVGIVGGATDGMPAQKIFLDTVTIA